MKNRKAYLLRGLLVLLAAALVLAAALPGLGLSTGGPTPLPQAQADPLRPEGQSQSPQTPPDQPEEPDTPQEPDTPEDPQEAPILEDSPFQVVRSKKFDIKPMSVEEAILRMNLLGHNFFAFRDDAAGGAFSVVYARKDGGYGLIEDSEI